MTRLHQHRDHHRPDVAPVPGHQYAHVAFLPCRPTVLPMLSEAVGRTGVRCGSTPSGR
jgi:hypothetical protein